ncbi:hypothetical protein AX777_11350 [Sphingobium yanoikuyae]|uniref:GapR-like DNA-binding domain-containing protein n=1 Tax=Sphingobium yanoikuyae TaxID=13690 RepID=A0A177JKE3_SPHYA|nr:DUF2312 domain-containing protein [Sphingobium yanoikuyae]OAH41274.1 hypothetical protein AX777_11350 [Sphingobium yanoikuyae]
MSDNIAVDILRQHVEAIERLESEEQGLKDDKKDRYLALKSEGFDVKAVRKLVAMRKKRADERTQEEAVLATYAAALGMQLGFDI